jgi:hypothetical protein
VSDPSDGPPPSQIILYQAEDRQTHIEVRLDGGTVWLTQVQIAELFQTSVPNINLHLKEIFETGESEQAATVKRYLTVRREGTRQVRREVLHYNLEAILTTAAYGTPGWGVPLSSGTTGPASRVRS